MSKERFSEHMASGGSYSPDTLSGGFISLLAGIFNATRGSNSNGSSMLELVDFTYSIAERLQNSCPLAPYKDDPADDTDLKFSLPAWTFDFAGFSIVFAGQTAITGLAAGATRYIYLDLAAAPTVTVGVSAAWPTTTPHIKIGAIAAPATGPWVPTNYTPWAHAQVIQAAYSRRITIRKKFVFGTSNPMALWAAPAGSRILSASLKVDTGFNGTTPTAQIGDSGSSGRLLGSTSIASAGAATIGQPYYEYVSQTQVNVYLSLGGSTAGAGEAFLEYVP